MNLLENLNAKQKEAVITEAKHVRIIAGAGSGKTRVLTTRIAYLIDELGFYPERIIGFTFTNKAAEEMVSRVKGLLNNDELYVRLSTYHAFGARFLREEIKILGITPGFTIFDDEDTRALIRNICVERGHEKRGEISKLAISFIGNMKEKGEDAFKYKVRPHGFIHEAELVKIWREYETRLQKMGSLDFADLILKTLIILETYPEIRKKWQSRFDHILVDEFQDTNDLQYRLVKLLKHLATELYVVGDPDQTIYTWRGAKEEIILNLHKDFPDTVTITLEQNYRSSEHILNAANLLIKNNKNRLEKNLFTAVAGGEPVIVKELENPEKEAAWVYEQITLMKLNIPGFSFADVAILMRANYLTLPFEQYFVTKGMRYEIYGGLKFYQRAEVKDALAYIRLLANEKDDISLLRIINTPRRGIGDVTLEKIKIAALKNEFSLLETLRYVEDIGLSESVKAKLSDVIAAIDDTRKKITSGKQAFSAVILDYITRVGYFEYIKQEKDPDREEAMHNNVQTLIFNIDEFQDKNPDASFNTYLENVALHSSQDEVKTGDYITLMTVHMAKGLEYDYIFVVGLMEGVFPGRRAIEEAGHKGEEEERRLAYVAFTRARKRLYLSYTRAFNFAIGNYGNQSRFIAEAGLAIPKFKKYHPAIGTPKYQEGGVRKENDAPRYRRNFFDFDYSGDFPYAINDIVHHKTFGHGVVTAVSVESAIITVKFDNDEVKKIKVPNNFIQKG